MPRQTHTDGQEPRWPLRPRDPVAAVGGPRRRHEKHRDDGGPPWTKQRGRPRSERLEKAIIDATFELLRDHGLAGVSMEGVAHLAGVAKTTVYRRWARKTDLLRDVIASVDQPPMTPPGDSVRGDILFTLSVVADPSRHCPVGSLMVRISADLCQHPELVSAFKRHLVAPRREVLRDVLARGVAEELIDADADLGLIMDMLIAPVMVRSYVMFEPLSGADLERLVDIVLTGIAPGKGAGEPALASREPVARDR